MRRRWIVLGVAVLVLVGVPLGGAYQVLHSEAGVRWLLTQLRDLPTVRIEATGTSGTLAGPLSVEYLVVEHEAVRIEARGVQLDARLRPLLYGNVHLEQATIDKLDVFLKTREERPPEQPHFLPKFLEDRGA